MEKDKPEGITGRRGKTLKDIEVEKNRATDTCKKAEALAHEIIEMCIGKGITLKEFQMLKYVLPDAINDKLNEMLYSTKLS